MTPERTREVIDNATRAIEGYMLDNARLQTENERLRAALHTARGALLCIGSTDSNWAEYARNVAAEVADPLEQKASKETK